MGKAPTRLSRPAEYSVHSRSGKDWSRLAGPRPSVQDEDSLEQLAFPVDLHLEGRRGLQAPHQACQVGAGSHAPGAGQGIAAIGLDGIDQIAAFEPDQSRRTALSQALHLQDAAAAERVLAEGRAQSLPEQALGLLPGQETDLPALSGAGQRDATRRVSSSTMKRCPDSSFSPALRTIVDTSRFIVARAPWPLQTRSSSRARTAAT